MIGIVILNYKNWDDTRQCVESIHKNPPEDAYQIILVDNASENRPEYDLEGWVRKHQILFIQNKENLGYNAGNNVGIRKALETGCCAVLISNNDVKYFPGSIQCMRDYLKKHPHTGIVGPKILDGHGRVQKSCICRRVGLKEKYLVCTKANLLFRNSYRSYFGFDRDYHKTFPVYAVLGCCFMMSRSCAEAVTPFDEHPFLYEEEAMLGIRMEQAGLETVYDPQATVEHLHGGSTKYHRAAAFTQNIRSEIYYCKNYLKAADWQIYPLYIYRILLYLLRCAKSREFRKNWNWFLETTVSEMTKAENIETENAGMQNIETENAGMQNTETENSGMQNAETENSGMQNTGIENAKTEYERNHRKGLDSEIEEPLVSVLIRTCKRPQILKRALNSIRQQTYANIEVIIVEDGKNTAEEMLKKEYADLRYVYEAAGKKIGRSTAGNRAMQLSSGVYLNFLDDDDELFPEHIQRLVNALRGRKEKAAYSVAQERQSIIQPEDRLSIRQGKNGSPLMKQAKYRILIGKHKWSGDRLKNRKKSIDLHIGTDGCRHIKKKYIRYRQPFHRLLLYTENYIPIQSILFERSLFETYGGMDEEIGMMEDWDLWVRYSIATDFVFVDQVTSCYYVPYKRKHKKERADGLKTDVEKLDKKFRSYQMTMTVGQIHEEMKYIIREYKNRGLLRYMRMFFRIFVLGE